MFASTALCAVFAVTPGLDGDGLREALVERLVERFAPHFLVSRHECDQRPAEFDRASAGPRPMRRNGTVYGRVFPVAPEGRYLQVQYYHRWARDCGRASHNLDAEHVSVLLKEQEDCRQALYWYAAAHEDTLCDRGHDATSRDPTVRIPDGRHASFLSARLCDGRSERVCAGLTACGGRARRWENGDRQPFPHRHWSLYQQFAFAEMVPVPSFSDPTRFCHRLRSERVCAGGCGGDQSHDMAAPPRASIVNLGEPGAPLNGARWLASERWPLAVKMTSDFPPAALAELDRDPEAGIVALNSSFVPVRAVLRAGAVTGAAVGTGNRHTAAALGIAHEKVDGSLRSSYRATRSFLSGAAGPWISLFDGRTLNGWRTSPRPNPPQPGWIVEKGTIRTTPGQGVQDYLVSRESFTNFEFRFEWKVEPKANSGVKYRAQGWWAPKGGMQPGFQGMDKFEPAAAEYQIADDERNPDALSNPKHSAGALYEFAAPVKDKPARAGQWHSSRIVVDGTRFEHWLDGKRVAEGDFVNPDLIQSRTRRGTASVLLKHARRDSPVILQFHNGVAWFRNLKIRKLPE